MGMKNYRAPLLSFFIGLTLLFVSILALRTLNDPDIWWHLRSGNEMVSHAHILTTDVFSYTRFGGAWMNVFWLADIGLYLLYRAAGFSGLSVLVAAVAAGIMAIILKHSPGPIILRLGLILLASFSLPAFMNPRPQIFTFLLLAALDFGLTRFKQNRNISAWLLIPFMGKFTWRLFSRNFTSCRGNCWRSFEPRHQPNSRTFMAKNKAVAGLGRSGKPGNHS
jgi:hypothetical protein